MHKTLPPEEAALRELSQRLKVDPKYTRMTQLQRCFRARLTPKPWRMGLPRLRRGAGSAWPVRDPQAQAKRSAWIARYDAKRPAFAACRFLAEFGQGATDPTVAIIRAVHDEWCGARSSRPLA